MFPFEKVLSISLKQTSKQTFVVRTMAFRAKLQAPLFLRVVLYGRETFQNDKPALQNHKAKNI